MRKGRSSACMGRNLSAQLTARSSPVVGRRSSPGATWSREATGPEPLTAVASAFDCSSIAVQSLLGRRSVVAQLWLGRRSVVTEEDLEQVLDEVLVGLGGRRRGSGRGRRGVRPL